MKSSAVIVSAGRGHRLAGEQKKQFLPLAGRPILCHTLDRFETSPSIDLIHLVVGQDDMDYTLKNIIEVYGYRKISKIVPGGKMRQESVRNGMDTLPPEVNIVVIHDGVRPFVTHPMIEESIRMAKQRSCTSSPTTSGSTRGGWPSSDTSEIRLECSRDLMRFEQA